ncbi:MAG: hypothetical protein CMO66_00170 [Verrucomicrobiales bacterium]|nr:hypothetical protein [Verrucomicrobiales bacterium]MBR89678.1 hypothetical protein [Verrucomicrobiales bacterium]|tara:strand:+ start:130 stop:561 length:432 start_codon:yes stop_codon:yes gene_type:complete
MSISDLPAINATLNFLSTVFLVAGFVFIKKGNQETHKKCMIAAFATSTIFLACYLYYHFNTEAVTRFTEPQWFRSYYLVLLFTHVVLAVVMLPFIFLSLWHAWKQNFEKHRRFAKWAWPIWLYVSITGVLVYLILYQIFPQAK